MENCLLPVLSQVFLEKNGFQSVSTSKNLILLTNMPRTIFGNMARLVLKINATNAAKSTVLPRN